MKTCELYGGALKTKSNFQKGLTVLLSAVPALAVLPGGVLKATAATQNGAQTTPDIRKGNAPGRSSKSGRS